MAKTDEETGLSPRERLTRELENRREEILKNVKALRKRTRVAPADGLLNTLEQSIRDNPAGWFTAAVLVGILLSVSLPNAIRASLLEEVEAESKDKRVRKRVEKALRRVDKGAILKPVVKLASSIGAPVLRYVVVEKLKERFR